MNKGIDIPYLTTTVVVLDKDRDRADDKIRAIERVIHGAGFTTIRESINVVEAGLGSLPGHVYANIRQPLIHTLNLAHLLPLSSVWAGPEKDTHLGGPPLFVAESLRDSLPATANMRVATSTGSSSSGRARKSASP